MSLYQRVRKCLSHTNKSVLVGRQDEVEKMTEFLNVRLSSGKPGALYVSGAPGTGKTAALTQILNSLPVSPAVTYCRDDTRLRL